MSLSYTRVELHLVVRSNNKKGVSTSILNSLLMVKKTFEINYSSYWYGCYHDICVETII